VVDCGRTGAEATAAGIDGDQRQILLKLRILKPVIHHDDVRIESLDELGAVGSVRRDHCRRNCRKQQRLVADVPGAVRLTDEMRPLNLAAVTPCKETGTRSLCLQQFGDGNCCWRLAAAAGSKIADADDGKLRAIGCDACCA